LSSSNEVWREKRTKKLGQTGISFSVIDREVKAERPTRTPPGTWAEAGEEGREGRVEVSFDSNELAMEGRKDSLSPATAFLLTVM